MNEEERKDELEYLKTTVERSLDLGCQHLSHLSTPLGRVSYQRKADYIASLLYPGQKVLDWVCGYGQMSYFLCSRGFDVTA